MSATLALPLSAFELRDAVRQARRFDPVRLDRVLRLDASRGLAEVQASTSWQNLAAQLRPSSPSVADAWQRVGTIGESVEANAPGPDGRPVVAHVESLALVTPDGELRRVSREAHGELFALVVGGQGLFGALYSVTLRLESLAQAAAGATPAERLALPASEGSKSSVHLLLPPERCQVFLEEARRRCGEWHTAIESVEVRHTAAEAETALRWARREYVAIELVLSRRETLGGSVRATQLARELIDLAISQGGSFPIDRTPQATRAQAEACYPQLRRVLGEKKRLDPAEKLSNGWYRHYRGLLGREQCLSRWNA